MADFQTIKVTVHGPRNSGSTTVARILAQALQAYGIDVGVNEDNDQDRDEVLFNSSNPIHLAANAVRQKSRVEIDTRAMNKSPAKKASKK